MSNEETINFKQFNPELEIVDKTYVKPRTNHINIVNKTAADKMRSFRTDKKAKLSTDYIEQINASYSEKNSNDLNENLTVPSESKQFTMIFKKLGKLNGLVAKSNDPTLMKFVTTPDQFKQALDDKFYEMEAFFSKREDAKNKELIDLTKQLLVYTQEKDDKLELNKQKDAELLELSQQLLTNTQEKDEHISKLEEENNKLKRQLQQQQLLNQKLYYALNKTEKNEDLIFENNLPRTM